MLLSHPTYIAHICRIVAQGIALTAWGVVHVQHARSESYCPDTRATPNQDAPTGFSVTIEQPLVLVLVDFPDGRLPDGRPPVVDGDLSLVRNIDAVGSMGYVREGADGFRATTRKYTYEDYWDAVFAPLFSTEPYVGSRHPDFSTHEGYVPPITEDLTQEIYHLEVYGSVRDYWEEVSYGKLLIQPAQTREYGRSADKYSSGIANNVIREGGKNYVRWICLAGDKTEYSLEKGLDPIRSTVERLRALHQDPSSREYLEFDIDAYRGKIAIIASGGRLGGWAGRNAREFIVPEKMQYLQNSSPSVLFNPIREFAHEFGHAIGIEHQAVGPYDIMTWGGLGLRRYGFCPPHVNPWLKLRLGWLSSSDIVKITSGQSVSLPPITGAEKKVALITLYGEAGRAGDYEHSEYFLVEYRKREKFNRFSGGPYATFPGGALVWHYARYGQFPYPGGDEGAQNLGLKVPGYGREFMGNGGSPSHFYYSGNSVLDPTTNPSSCSIDGCPTGVCLSGFRASEESLQFTVSYSGGAVPSWDRFYRAGETIEFPLRGTVYVEGTRTVNQISLAEGSQVHLSPGGGFIALHCTATRSTLQCNGASYLRIAGTLSVSGSLAVRGTGTLSFRSNALLFIGSNSNLTTEPGTTLNITPGTTLRSDPGGIFIVRGKLIAKGSAQNRIAFTSSGTSWGGLIMSGRGADNSLLEYVDIDNVRTCGGAAVSVLGARSLLVNNCSITNNASCGTHGLFLWNAGWPEIACNNISSNGGYGVGFAASWGYLYRNTISANTVGGVYCNGWASPSFGKPGFDATLGNNRIIGGTVGIRAADCSNPCVGLSEALSYGYNTIKGESIARVSASDNCRVVAEMNFWGEGPESSWFVVREGSAVDWQPCLGREPGGLAASLACPLSSPLEDSSADIAKASRYRLVGEYLRAKQILSSAIRDHRSDGESAEVAAELVALYSETGDPELMDLCRSAIVHGGTPDPFFTLAEAKILELDGFTAEARKRLNEVIALFPGTDCARTALLDLCFMSVCEPGSSETTTSWLSALRQLEPDDENVRMALWLLSQTRGQERPVGDEGKAPGETDSQGKLMTTLEVFPNPFNSSTTIRYRLAEGAHVLLSVYNTLGQTVATLEDGEKETGCHMVRFDASGLSSGEYFCRLKAGKVTKTWRMLHLR